MGALVALTIATASTLGARDRVRTAAPRPGRTQGAISGVAAFSCSDVVVRGVICTPSGFNVGGLSGQARRRTGR
jgi:hypothetical protein